MRYNFLCTCGYDEIYYITSRDKLEVIRCPHCQELLEIEKDNLLFNKPMLK